MCAPFCRRNAGDPGSSCSRRSRRFRCYHGSTPPATRFLKFKQPGMSTIATAVASVVVGIVVSCSFLQDIPGNVTSKPKPKVPMPRTIAVGRLITLLGAVRALRHCGHRTLCFGIISPFINKGPSSLSTSRQRRRYQTQESRIPSLVVVTPTAIAAKRIQAGPSSY